MSTMTNRTETATSTDSLVTRVTDHVMTRVGLFPAFYVPLACEFATRLDAGLRELAREREDTLFDTDAILVQAVYDYLDIVTNLASRTLILRFHEAREAQGIAPDPAATTAYDAFDSSLSEASTRAGILTDYPVLDELLSRATDLRLGLLAEVATAYVSDVDDLRGQALAPVDTISALRASDGDPHNGGRCVVLVDYIGGGRLVYKPRSLGVDALTTELLDIVNPHLEGGCALALPGHLDRESYGWQEFVAAHGVDSIEAARRYAYRMGAFAAFFGALGTTDLHFENVIAAGEHPTFVDLETLLHHEVPAADGAETPPTGVMSILNTGLLPFQVPGSPYDIDMSGIGALGPQTSHMTAFTLVDMPSDAVRMEKTSFEVEHGANLLRIGSTPVAVGEFADDLAAGLRDAIVGMRHCRDALVETLRAARVAPIRQVMRATAIYGRFLDASTHPSYLASHAERRRLLSRMHPVKHTDQAFAEKIHDLEVTALYQHDIPFFHSPLHERFVEAPHLGSVDMPVPRPLAEQAVLNLDDFLGRSLAAQEHVIRMAVAGCVGPAPLTADDARPSAGDYLASALATRSTLSTRVADILEDVDVSPTNDKAAWLNPTLSAQDTVNLSFALLNLYDGAGIPLALAAEGRHELAARALSPEALDGVPGPDQPMGLSIWGGRAGAGYLVDEMTRLGTPGVGHRRDGLIGSVVEAALTTEAAVRPPDGQEDSGYLHDLMGGFAGTAAYLAALRLRGDALVEPGTPAARTLQLSATEMTRLLGTEVLPTGEFAHGRLGVAWALARVSAALRVEVPEIAVDVLGAELAHWRNRAAQADAHAPNLFDASWCKGYAGALLGLGEGLRHVGHESDDIVDLLAPLTHAGLRSITGRGRDLTPCHGATGLVQSLLHLANVLDHPAYRHTARLVLTSRLERVADIGYVGGLHRSQGFLGYMVGLTGVAHTTTLIDHPERGIPLALTPHTH